MTFYSDMQKVASSVMSDFKQGTVKLVKIAAGTGPAYDPGTPIRVEHDLDATVSGISFQYQQEGFSTSTDLQVIAAVLDGITPTLNDFVKIDGIEHKIVRDLTVPSAGTKVVWKFIVRKGG